MAGITTRIIELLGMGERSDLPSDSAPEADHAATGGEAMPPPRPGPGVEQGCSADDPILQSLKRAWSGLLNDALPKHLNFAPGDALFLERIEISAKGDASVDLLARFMKEFRPQVRIDYVRHELGKDLGRNLMLDQFTGIWDASADESAPGGAPPPEDAFDKILAGLGSTGKGGFRVRLIGHWGEKPAPRPVAGGVSPGQRAGARLHLTLWDGEAPAEGRPVSVQVYPTALCRKGGESEGDDRRLPIEGTYVSGLHGILEWDGVAATVSDGPSRNGLWLNDTRLKANEPRRLTAGDLLRFSSPEDRDAAHYPRLRVDRVEGAQGVPVAGHTPVTTPVAGVTPVTLGEGVSAATPTVRALALLSILDAGGSRQLDVTRLPFRIGRGRGQDYVIPDGNAGASREHLVILEMDERGAKVSHPAATKLGGRWGDGGKEPLAAEFRWPWGREILLAPDYPKAPPVRLTLRRVV
jgi:hypothetical protein